MGEGTCTPWPHFPQCIPSCFTRAERQVHCQVLSALLTDDQGTHPIGLTPSPFFLHGWSGLCAALKHGRSDRQRIQRTLAEFLPAHRWANGWIVTALDVSPIPRPCSPTAEERPLVHVTNLPKGAKPVLPGWQVSLLVGLPPPPSSLISPLEATRIPRTQPAFAVGAEQIGRWVKLFAGRLLVIGDRAYPHAPFLQALAQVEADLLVRVRKDRVWYRPAPPSTGKRGAPRKDGDRFQGSKPETLSHADLHWQSDDESIVVDAWNHLHLKGAREGEGTVIRVTRLHPTGSDARERWRFWRSPFMPPLEQIADRYRLRFCIEHGIRFAKQSVHWAELRVRTQTNSAGGSTC